MTSLVPSLPTDRASSIGSLRAMWLVARRELRVRLATRSYRLTTLLLALGALVAVLLGNHFGGTTTPLAIGSTDPGLTDTVQTVLHDSHLTATVGTVSSQEAGETQLRDDTLDALLVPGTDGAPFEVVVHQQLNPQLQGLFDSLTRESLLADQVRALGGDPAEVAAVMADARAPVTSLEEPDGQGTARFLIAYVTGMLIFMSLMIGAQVVAQGVVEEKSSRVVEVLLATLKPRELMAGKVIGIGLALLLQFGLAVVVAAIAARATGLLSRTGVTLGPALLGALAWYLLGFTAFAVLFAALGSLVSRQEEVSSVITPVTTLMFLPYFLGLTVLPNDPHNALATVLSFVPFFAPFLMPIRAALGVAPLWQSAAALLISLVTLPLLVLCAGRVYRNAVLRTGARTKLRDALRAG